MSQRIHKKMYGSTERYDFAQIKDVLDIPYLIEVQRKSYDNFVNYGIKEVLRDYSPICDYSNRYELTFEGHDLNGKPKHSAKECKDLDTTYAVPLKVKVKLKNNIDGTVAVQDVFMGDFPLMTESGSFIINGAERVVVSQLVRSPGVYNKKSLDKNGVPRYNTTVIPNRGAWLEFDQDYNNVLWVHVDRQRKITATTLIRALMDKGTNKDIIDMFGEEKLLETTFEKDAHDECVDSQAAKLALFQRLRQGEIPTLEGAETVLYNTFSDYKRYEVARVGRYKYNKKLSIALRIEGYKLARDVISPVTGEVLAVKGDIVSEEVAQQIQNNAVNEVYLEYVEEGKKKEFKVVGNNTVDLDAFVDCNPKELDVLEKVYYPELKRLMDEFGDDKEQLLLAIQSDQEIVSKHITYDDIFATVSYNIGLTHGFGTTDDIDHLSNRRVRSVGELLQNQFRIGISRLEKAIKDKMSSQQEGAVITPVNLINVRPITSAINEFFGSSQLSQFMDQPNPIAELTHKRKLSALGAGGLNRDRASFEVRDVHYSHYGRMCPIETPEGQNIGLISSLSTYAKVNEYGFIETPYRKIDKKTGVVTDEVVYMAADTEDKYIIAQANAPLYEEDTEVINEETGEKELHLKNTFKRKRVMCRIKSDIREVRREKVDYMDVSPKQLISIATALIPFLENDDTNRALMGSNMQRQAVPLLKPEAPMIATGVEHKIAYDSGVLKIARHDGYVKYVDSDKIIVERDVDNADQLLDEEKEDVYELSKFTRSNQSTCINQHPIVSKGEKVYAPVYDKDGNLIKEGTVLADGPATDHGELALGRNILIGFMSWEGYNYEDAVLISEELVKDDVFTSIHIEKHETEAKDTKLGEEQITRDIPNLSEEALKNLDADGIIRIGAEVKSGDILVGKVTPKGEAELTPEERLLRAIFGEKSRDVRDTSLRVPNGEAGVVVDVKIFTRKNKDELPPGVSKQVRVFIAQKRKISVGDKMAGRHGNKGVVSRVLPKEDMPFMEDGTPLQIVLNPLGVPSRMNIGQVLEVHLGYIAKLLNWKISTPVFDGAKEQDIKQLFLDNGIVNPEGKVDGKIQLYDGRTGEPFENRVTVGYMYYLKLHHLVDDKIHARATGPYSLVTQQPLGGKAQNGGQRFGEMEVWALEAYGASNILQEILTVKSDDVTGRVKAYDSIVKGINVSEPGIPESFKVLVKELQSLALDVRVLTESHDEVKLRDTDEELDFESSPLPKETDYKEIDITSGENNIFGDLMDDNNDDSDLSIFDSVEDDGDIFANMMDDLNNQDDESEDSDDAFDSMFAEDDDNDSDSDDSEE